MAQIKMLQRCLFKHNISGKSEMKNFILTSMYRCSRFQQATHNSTSVTSALPEHSLSPQKPERKTRKHNQELNQIRQATNVESLLSIVDSGQRLSMTSAVTILNKACMLSKKENLDLSKLASDDRVQSLAVILDKMVLDLPTGVLVSALGSLLEISSGDSNVMESLERQVLWLMPKMTAGQLTSVIAVYQKHQETEIRQKIFMTAKGLIEKRWVEISTGDDVVSLMYYFGVDSEEMFPHLEERALDLSEKMTAKNLYHVFYLMSKKGKRNAPLLRALVYHMNRQKLALNHIQLMNLTFACAKLNVYDTTLLETISSKLLNSYSANNFDKSHAFIISSLVRSFSNLRWRNLQLLEMFSSFYSRFKNDVPANDLGAFLQACANLNFITSENADVFDMVVQNVDRSSHQELLLHTVWSLAVLGKSKVEFLESVLTPEFYRKLTSSEDSAVVARCTVQLLNLNSAAKYDAENYQGPLLSEDEIQSYQNMVAVKKASELTDLVAIATENFAPSPKYMNRSVKTPTGHVIDMEMLVNSEGQPQPLDSEPNVDLHRIAIKVHQFADLTLQEEHVPTGRTALACRQLKQLGYKLVEVPHYEFSEKTTVVDQVQYLQKKIKDAL